MLQNTTDTTIILSELEEFVQYNVSVRAYSSVGPGPYSVHITEETLDDSMNMQLLFVCS